MVEVITVQRWKLLQLIAKHPNVTREQLLKAGAGADDIAYLEKQDMVREREAGKLHVSHFGDMALKRGL
jgi:hypothetical protein